MRTIKCQHCGMTYKGHATLVFTFPHCAEEQKSRAKQRLKFLDLKPELTSEEKKERGKLLKFILGVRYATPAKNQNL